MKVQLDLQRERLADERDRGKRLLSVAAELIELLQHSYASEDNLDGIAESYSAVITQLATPANITGAED